MNDVAAGTTGSLYYSLKHFLCFLHADRFGDVFVVRSNMNISIKLASVLSFTDNSTNSATFVGAQRWKLHLR